MTEKRCLRRNYKKADVLLRVKQHKKRVNGCEKEERGWHI
jgi:hypothetical protein